MKGPYTDQEINIAEIWHLNRDQFLEDNGISADEPRLKAYIAEEMDISVDDVRLPMHFRSEYVPVLAD